MNDTLGPRIPLGEWVDAFVGWVTTTFRPLFRFIKDVLVGVYDGLDAVLSGPPFWVVAIALAALAFFVKGWRLAVGTRVGVVLSAGG